MSNNKSKHLGKVGQKLPMELTILNVHSFEGGFGNTNVYNMIDSEGNYVTKFGVINDRYLTSGKKVSVGSKVRFNATVKKHDQFNGSKQTTIGRVSKFK
jgi:hypothetical protein